MKSLAVRRARTLAVAVMAGLLTIFGVVLPAAAAPAPAVLSAEQALLADADMYASALGVSRDQAVEVLRDQLAAGPVIEQVAALAPARFAGGWLTQNPLTLNLRFTEGLAVPGLQVLLRALDFPVAVTYDAAVTKTDLVAAADRAAQLFVGGARGIDGVQVDERGNGLTLIGNRDADATAVDLITFTLGRAIPVTLVQTDSAPAMDTNRGGVNLRNSADQPECTAGFSVKQGSANGLVTAGHCANNLRYGINSSGSTPWSLTFITEQRTSLMDMQWGNTSAHNAVASFYGSSASTPTARTGSGTASVGQFLCHRGVTTGYSCGTVSSTNFAPTWSDACPGTSCAAAFVKVDNIGNLKGDSGGPWFSGGNAYGVHKGGELGSSGVWACYTPINKIASLGVTLV